jgi:peptide deformylase
VTCFKLLALYNLGKNSKFSTISRMIAPCVRPLCPDIRTMSLLTILEFPDPRLRKKAAPVETMDDALREILDNMIETMYEAEGIGLAATQVDVHKRMLVIDVSEERNNPLIFINPEITVLDPEPLGHEEGCLSVPGFYELVNRPRKVRINSLDRNGEAFEQEAEGILAVCIQHEIDHLDGKLFVDYLSTLKRQRIKSKLEKEHRQHKTAASA